MDTTGSSPTIVQPPDPHIGKVLGNEFRLTRLLGKGGMGAVYLGEQLSLMRPVAVKLLPAAASQDSESSQRFQREAVAAARLQHPNIVQVYFFGQDEGQRFIAMEYVEGESLYGYMRRKNRLSLDESLKIAREVARGLGAAHKLGLVHRDVKPENVFISKEGRVKLGDFGLARDTQGDARLSVTGQVMGTPYYMPPEQCRGQKVDARADIYALGATIYHMVTGVPPYQGDSAFDIMNKHVSSPVPGPEAFGQGVPKGVVDLVRKMMAKEAAERPANADEVIAEIGQVLAANPPAARAAGKPPSTSSIKAIQAPTAFASGPKQPAVKEPLSPFERNLRWYAVGACVLLVAIVGGLWKLSHHDVAVPAPIGPSVASQPSTPPPVTPPPPPPDPPPVVGEPLPLKAARDMLQKGEPGMAVRRIDEMPPILQHGAFAEQIRALRAEALAKLMVRVEAKVHEFAGLMEKRQYDAAEEILKSLEGIGVVEVNEKAKQLRAQLDQAKKAHVATEADWGKLATEVWALAQQWRWREAVARCGDAEKDPSFAAFQDRIATFSSVVDGGRQAQEEIVKALRALKGKAVSLKTRSGDDVSGMLSDVDDSGDCKVEPSVGKGPKVVLSLANLAAGEAMTLVREWHMADASHGLGILVWMLSRGDTEFADQYLTIDATAAEVRKALGPVSTGWKAPWSAEEVEHRQKEREKVAPAYARMASSAWQSAQRRRWDEAIEACKRARHDDSLAMVGARVAALERMMTIGRDTDATIVKVLKAKVGTAMGLPRKQGDEVKGKLTEVTDNGDCTVVNPRAKTHATVRLAEIPVDRLVGIAREELQKEENTFAGQIVFAMALGDYDVADKMLKNLIEKHKGVTWFDITSEGWDAAPWSAASYKSRGK